MNLNEMQEAASEINTRKVEFIFRDNPTGLILELNHESSQSYQKAEREYRNKLNDAAMRRKNTLRERITNDWLDFGSVMAKVVGWEWKDGVDPDQGRPAFSRQELRANLASSLGYDLRNFIIDESDRIADFTKG